jgi:hypothetical protein
MGVLDFDWCETCLFRNNCSETIFFLCSNYDPIVITHMFESYFKNNFARKIILSINTERKLIGKHALSSNTVWHTDLTRRHLNRAALCFDPNKSHYYSLVNLLLAINCFWLFAMWEELTYKLNQASRQQIKHFIATIR